MTPVEILQQAQQLIRNPNHWTQNVSARTAEGHQTDTEDPAATSFCAVGACYAIFVPGNYTEQDQAQDFLNQAALQLFSRDVVSANDTLSHRSVMRMFNRAIKLAQEEA